MFLFTIKLVVDFGLLVLIWMVQLIIYPSFLHYPKENLITWHKKYTLLIAYIVGPLMLLQLAFSIYQVILNANFFTIGNLVMVVAIWCITFVQFIPMHGAISKGKIHKSLLSDLIKKNWSRTLLWNLIFLWNILYYIENGL